MHTTLIRHAAGLSSYIAEMFAAWGWLAFDEQSLADALKSSAGRTLVLPAMPLTDDEVSDLLQYVAAGGRAIVCQPDQRLLDPAKLTYVGQRVGPTRLRVVQPPAFGLAGETLPIVGSAMRFKPAKDFVGSVHSFLTLPSTFADESAGIVDIPMGKGRLILAAFDWPRVVMTLRQGDPARAEYIPAPDVAVRASWLAADLGGDDIGWIPFADLLSKLLIDLVAEASPAPMPTLHHMPEAAKCIVLYSGDEDVAPVDNSDDEFAAVTEAGGRMNLYIIPGHTKCTPDDTKRWAANHDLGPHPDLRPLDGRPMAERLACYAAQVKQFESQYGIKARTVRQHNLTWIGYTDLAELLEELGVGLDSSFMCSGSYLHSRDPNPYRAFGGALPMRFCRLDGHMIEVYQQHLHIEDDVHFSDHIDYSFKWSPAYFESIFARMLDDMLNRFHLPITANLHPSNWVKFSEPQGMTILRQAAERGVAVWSFDQWLTFLQARRSVTLNDVVWQTDDQGSELRATVDVTQSHADLRLSIPRTHQNRTLSTLTFAGQPQDVPNDEPAVPISLDGAAGVTSLHASYR